MSYVPLWRAYPTTRLFLERFSCNYRLHKHACEPWQWRLYTASCHVPCNILENSKASRLLPSTFIAKILGSIQSSAWAICEGEGRLIVRVKLAQHMDHLICFSDGIEISKIFAHFRLLRIAKLSGTIRMITAYFKTPNRICPMASTSSRYNGISLTIRLRLVNSSAHKCSDLGEKPMPRIGITASASHAAD